jgi:hypothetical protein
MNPHDLENLKFLLHSPPETIQHWLAQADADDIAYANELIAAFKEEKIEKELTAMIEYPDAKRVIDNLLK